MNTHSAVQTFWRAARGGLARLNQLLAEGDAAEESVFLAPRQAPERRGREDAERRIAEARDAGLRESKGRRPI